MTSPKASKVPHRGSLRSRQRERTRGELISAALSAFDDLGYPAVTIEEIAARAGAAKGTVYTHFPEGRDGLFREVYTEASQRTIERAQELHDEASDLSEQIAALAQATLETASEPILGTFFLVSGPGLAQAMGPVLGQTSRAFTEILTADLKGAALADGVVPQAVAPLLVGAIREAGMLVCRGAMTADDAISGIRTLAEGLLHGH